VQIYHRHSGAMREHRTGNLDVIKLWIPGSRRRAAQSADPLARPGMTAE
jgi:hypothetical protein